MTTLIHVTHEAVRKVGGIGAVLHGYFTSRAYNEEIDRSILVGPLFDEEAQELLAENGAILYSSSWGIDEEGRGEALRPVEEEYGVGIVYGRRTFRDPETNFCSEPEILLIDVSNPRRETIDAFKAGLYENFGIASHLYDQEWDYEQYVRLAPPALAALDALGAAADGPAVIQAHEFMGVPTALAAVARGDGAYRTMFHAHEVATMRRIVEDHPGHDTMFYNVLAEAIAEGKYVEDVFGMQRWFKHALITSSRHLDLALCVGDHVMSEMRFLDREFGDQDLRLAYNGIPSYDVTVEDIEESKGRLQLYADHLLGQKPDWIFTHVTRMALSKGLWRDLKVLWHLEQKFRKTGQTGVYFLLSSELGAPRKPHEVQQMADGYGWPLAHREGYPDLSGGEAGTYVYIQAFNATARQIKIVYVNQFGWNRMACGKSMPKDMSFLDIRKGTDIEFGQSIYEPFGIAQLEPLSFGGLCVVTNVCGCAGFVDKATGGRDVPNVLVADYTQLGAKHSLDDALSVGARERDAVEEVEAERVAKEVLARLPADHEERADRVASGVELAREMSWEVVCRDYLLPAVRDVLAK